MPRPLLSDLINVPVVTSLPVGPSDGMEVDLVADDAAAYGGPYLWRCKYRAGSVGTYKWHVIGDAPPLIVESLTFVTVTQQSPATFSGAPTITLPFPGDWDITTYAQSLYKFGAAGYGYVGPGIAGAAASQNDAIIQYNGSAADFVGSQEVTRRKTVAGTRVVQFHAWVNTGSLYPANNTTPYGLRCKPVRLG